MLRFCVKGLGTTVLAQRCWFGMHKKDHLFEVSRQLLQHWREYKPWKNVRILHSITMARYDPDLANLEESTKWKEDQPKINEIIENLSGELHALPHKETNMLLEVLKESGAHYHRDSPIMRSLNKHSKMLVGHSFKGDQLLKTMSLLISLRFPKATICKMMDCYLQLDLQQSKKKEQLKVPLDHLLKLCIMMLQSPFMSLPSTHKLLTRVVKENISTLDNLCSLYHISTILRKSLKGKIEYQYSRSQVRDLLFNPYAQVNEQETAQTSTQQSNEESEDYKLQLKRKLTQLSSEIIKTFTNSVEISKLQSAITKAVFLEMEPLTKQSLLFAADIPDLKPTVNKYLSANLGKTTPLEFIYLLKRCPNDTVSQHIQNYFDSLGQYMDLQETAFLHLQLHTHFQQPVSLALLHQLVSKTSKITYADFVALGRLMEVLSAEEQRQIPELLAAVKAKLQAGQEAKGA